MLYILFYLKNMNVYKTDSNTQKEIINAFNSKSTNKPFIKKNLDINSLEHNENLNKNLIKINLLLLGDEKVGKSQIIERFCSNNFNKSYIPTNELEHSRILVNINNIDVNLGLYSSSSFYKISKESLSEVFNCITGIIYVFDLTSKQSYNNIDKYSTNLVDYFNINKNENLISYKKTFLLIGNKSDLKDSFEIDYEDCIVKAKSLNAEYHQTSAYLNDNLEKNIIDYVKNIMIMNKFL